MNDPKNAPSPRRFILGTDWAGDCDDVVAVRLAVRAHREGKIDLRGICLNNCKELSAPSLVSFLRMEGGGDIAVSLDRGAVIEPEARYHKRLADACDPWFDNADAEDALQMYLRILRESDAPLEIMEIGHLQVLNAAYHAEPELFASRVRHLWLMAGRWDIENGREYNFCGVPFATQASHELLRDCPVPITFLGFEVGDPVLVGGKLPENDPVRQALVDYGTPDGRSAWDPMTVALALAGSADAAGYDAVRGTACVDPTEGTNSFAVSENGAHEYVVKRHPDAYYADVIDALIG